MSSFYRNRHKMIKTTCLNIQNIKRLKTIPTAEAVFYIIGNVCECSASGDPHYRLFDGQMIHFQGVCTYKLAEAWRGTCGLVVHVKNIRSDRNPRVSFTRTVYVFVGNDKIVIARNRIITVKLSWCYYYFHELNMMIVL